MFYEYTRSQRVSQISNYLNKKEKNKKKTYTVCVGPIFNVNVGV